MTFSVVHVIVTGGASTGTTNMVEELSQPRESHESYCLQFLNQMRYKKNFIQELLHLMLLVLLQ